jgi:hypothetical protein
VEGRRDSDEWNEYTMAIMRGAVAELFAERTERQGETTATGGELTETKGEGT